jgi:hypothetical protein
MYETNKQKSTRKLENLHFALQDEPWKSGFFDRSEIGWGFETVMLLRKLLNIWHQENQRSLQLFHPPFVHLR